MPARKKTTRKPPVKPGTIGAEGREAFLKRMLAAFPGREALVEKLVNEHYHEWTKYKSVNGKSLVEFHASPAGEYLALGSLDAVRKGVEGIIFTGKKLFVLKGRNVTSLNVVDGMQDASIAPGAVFTAETPDFPELDLEKVELVEFLSDEEFYDRVSTVALSPPEFAARLLPVGS